MILVIAEQREGKLNRASWEALAAAQQLAGSLPIKVAVLPLSKKPELQEPANEVLGLLQQDYMCDYDETQAIGRRYRRQDELGTPFCVTIDFETLEDRAVTVRHRDSMAQDRVPIDGLADYLSLKLS